MDKYAHILCSDAERAIFLKNYLNESTRSPRFDEYRHKIVKYREARFDQRKGRSNVAPLDETR
jgi:hypothetical protein